MALGKRLLHVNRNRFLNESVENVGNTCLKVAVLFCKRIILFWRLLILRWSKQLAITWKRGRDRTIFCVGD